MKILKQLFRPIGQEPEKFKKVTYPGIEPNMYMISNYGRIYTIETKNELSGYIDEDGYPRVTLKRDKKVEPQFKSRLKNCSKHRLVAHEFIPNEDSDKNQVNHIDGNKVNSYYENLEWVTQSENGIHAYNTGLSITKGEQSHLNTAFTETQIHRICQLLSEGRGAMDIMNDFGFYSKNSNPSLYRQIYKLRQRKVWRHITEQYDY